MATLDLRASQLAVANETADTTTVVVTFLDQQGQPANLDGWTFTAPIMRGLAAVGAFTVDRAGNTLTLTLPAGTLAEGGYRWALVATTGGVAATWLAGPLTLTARGDTRTSATTEVTVTTIPSVQVSVQVDAAPQAEALAARLDEIEQQSPFMVWQ